MTLQLATPYSHPYESLIELWCVRAVVYAKSEMELVVASGLSKDNFFEFQKECTNYKGKKNPDEKNLLRIELFKQRLTELESMELTLPDTPLEHNLNMLCTSLQASETERNILRFSILIGEDPRLHNTLYFEGISRSQHAFQLHRLLGDSIKSINDALRNGVLVRKQLIEISKDRITDLTNLISLPANLDCKMMTEQNSLYELFDAIVSRSPDSKIKLEDICYLNREYNLVRNALTQALREKTTGVNILLYGEPGTGKTEIVRSLSSVADSKMYEILITSDNDSPLRSEDRLRYYSIAQNFLSIEGNSVLVVDELEDVFPDVHPWFASPEKSSRSKAWLNNMLDTNPIPTIWITNSISFIDNAYIRRFDLALEIKGPPTSQRKRIFEKYLGDSGVSSQWMEKLAQNSSIQPSHIEKLSRISNQQGSSSSRELENTLEFALKARHRALDLPCRVYTDPNQLTEYRPDLINTKQDLERVLKGLRNTKSGRIVFYGPPGTGKTAYARYLAQALDCPLHVKKVSDILSSQPLKTP